MMILMLMIMNKIDSLDLDEICATTNGVLVVVMEHSGTLIGRIKKIIFPL